MSIYFHEQLYRSADAMKRIAEQRVTVCGAGALGANIVESLARSGYKNLRVIDRDRVEERNLSTQPYYRSDIGAFKAKMLANAIYRAVGVNVEPRAEELNAENAKKLLDGLIVDVFDNSLSRRTVKDFCLEKGLDCLHAGLAGGYAEIIWNEHYRVPGAAQDDICDYPLARNLVMLAVSVACEVLTNFIVTGKRESYTITLKDFAVRSFEV